MKKLILFIAFMLIGVFCYAQMSQRGTTGTSDARYVNVTGDTMTGQLTTTSTITVEGSAFSVGGSTLVVKNGRVGIGNTAPEYDFSVKNVAPTMSMESGEGQANTMYFRSTVNRWNIQRTGAYDLQFYDYGGTAGVRLVLKTGGNIGIGNNDPATKLHISSGTLTIDGTGTGIQMTAMPATGVLTCWGAGNKIGYCESNSACTTCTVP